MAITHRGSGILMHLTSLPGPYGIGDLGKCAHDFIDFLVSSGQKFWQFLPTGPGSPVFQHSPYMSLSAFAGNPLLIDPLALQEDGLLSRQELERPPDFSEFYVEFERVTSFRTQLLSAAYEVFKKKKEPKAFTDFCQEEEWLDDYALFMSLREKYHFKAWYQWPRALAVREEEALAVCRRQLADRIRYYKFEQFYFFRQWRQLKGYAGQKGVSLLGDIPIYVGGDSVDVWAHQDCFRLHAGTLRPTHVAGVPPDYFSRTGQRWGNPLYRWQGVKGEKNSALYDWWRRRFAHIFKMVDVVRVDHFRAFEAFWEVPARENTAINGKWIKGPGADFFKEMEAAIGDLPIIAEDLGIITPEVEALRKTLGFPGMKILQFAFDSDADNLYLPHNYPSMNCVVYSGTHDNDTTVGWLLSPEVDERSKERARRYCNSRDDRQLHWDFIRLAFSSIAGLAIIPMQDLLGFGGDCRMNLPSTVANNWKWRCASHYFTPALAAKFKGETEFYGRLRKE